ncbi:EamA family transporter [Streptomyces sp. NPDC092296]|uniref:EamA family transporter n=1 Tax=Streptomyces sp. NPDC092296 TaxID=3366012 RepID=UPI003812ACA7
MRSSQTRGDAASHSGRGPALTLALVSACAFGGSGPAAKPLISAGLDPLHVVWLRVAGAALVLLPLAVRHRSAVRLRPGLLVGFGLLAVAGVQACYYASISRIPVGVALLIEYLGPPLLLGWVKFVQRRPVTRAAVCGAVLAVAGLACVVQLWSGVGFDPVGVVLALGAACCQVGYFVLADARGGGREPVDPMAVCSYGLLVGAVVLTAVARPWEMHWPVLAQRVAMGDARVPAALLVAWVVLVATVLAYLTGVVAVRRLSPPVAGVVSYLEAVVATVAAWVLLGEHLAGAQVAGGVMMLAGAFIAQTSTPGAPPSAEPPVPAAAAVGGGQPDGTGAAAGSE